ncbi:hypothetical protein AB0331_12245 [Dietzia maris]|uniref:hypothetical protein n=1 Tax=Dietzia maris TaxID=37915 RepID=UPI00344F85AC
MSASMIAYPAAIDGGAVWMPRPTSMERDGAHWSPCPCVPGVTTASGRGPGPVQGALGCRNVPVTAIGPPAAPVERYMIRWASAGSAPPFITSGRLGVMVIGWVRMIAPGSVGSSAGGT